MIFGKDKMKMSDAEKKAKLAALKEAKGMAEEAMKGDLAGAKKVVVKADSKEGLEKGLDMAKKVVDKGPSALGELESDDEEQGEKEGLEAGDYMDQQEESEPMDEAEIDEEIKRLLELKEKLQSKE